MARPRQRWAQFINTHKFHEASETNKDNESLPATLQKRDIDGKNELKRIDLPYKTMIYTDCCLSNAEKLLKTTSHAVLRADFDKRPVID